jgi:hypothetical protein
VTKKLRRIFPRLFGGRYRVSSKKSKKYNCLAWAAGRTDAWLEAAPDGRWPPGVPTDGSVEAAVRLFESLGFTRTNEASLEKGYVKVAVYGTARGYTHAARQLSDGRWTSKLGKLQDIEHDDLHALTGTYGSVVQFLKKPSEAAS